MLLGSNLGEKKKHFGIKKSFFKIFITGIFVYLYLIIQPVG